MFDIAIGSFIAECNPNSPVVGWPHFMSHGYMEGDDVLADLATTVSALPQELKGFFNAAQTDFDSPRFHPLVCANGSAAGPIDHACFEDIVQRMVTGIVELKRLDGIYLALHGAAKTTREEDPEGYLLQAIRTAIGPTVPILATLDLHANVTEAMIRASSALIGYQTNPHVDMYERGQDAAVLLGKMRSGASTVSVFHKIPMIAPSPTHLTAEDPMSSIWRRASDKCSLNRANISIFTGYTHGDSPKSGMSTLITGESGRVDEIVAIGRETAADLWRARDEFKLRLMDMHEAVERAVKAGEDPSLPAVAFADTNDNPGGGGRGNSIWALKAFVEAGVENALLGALYDPALAGAAHHFGEGASFQASFNADESEATSGKYAHEVRVMRLRDGRCTGRRGMYAGTALDLGPSCLLDVAGIQVVVISKRLQTADPIFFEMLGVDLAEVRSLVIKSRGHFRAGFDEFFSAPQIFDIDVPGLTMRRLECIEFKKIARPMYPIDRDFDWKPRDSEFISFFPGCDPAD